VEQGDENNLERLVAAGIDIEDIIRIANDAVWIFDKTRRPRGASNGVIGTTGADVYGTLSRTEDYDPDIEAFREYRPYSADTLGTRMKYGRQAVAKAMNRLIQHDFIEKRRDGRRFLVRLMIPEQSLTELGLWWSSTSAEPGSWSYDHERPLGETLLRLFPAAS
jgi:biotin operon repressor